MKLLYVRPYVGELDIVTLALPDLEIITAQSINELDADVLSNVTILSVFVDYQVTAAVLDALPMLQCVATRSAGYDHIDMAAAQERGVVVSRVPQYGTRTVAEYAIALMFALSRNAFRSYTDLQRDSSLHQFEAYQGFDLAGKTLGVVGTGAIGRSVCEIARGIGMQVVAYDVVPDADFAAAQGIVYSGLEEVLQQADIVTLHVPSIPQTHHLIGIEQLQSMKAGSYLINTARGEIIDTKALVAVLKSGHLAGAGLDVLEGEHELREEVELLANGQVGADIFATLVADHALIDMPNVIVTPHIAFNTIEAKREITDVTTTNIKQFVVGTPVNVVTV